MFYNKKVEFIVILLFIANLNCARSQCDSNDWTCDNDQCISDNKLCDGKVDCLDRSDEIAENCIHFHEICKNNTFRCSYGACIDESGRCNGLQDCADNSDELVCSQKDDSDFQGVCFATEIQCVNSKECINSIDLCNGRVDCKDSSDESLELCINYRCIGFKCGYGGCISRNAKCNGLKECADGSDEAWQLCSKPRKINNSTGSTPTPRPKPAPLAIGSPEKCIIPNIPPLQGLIFKQHPQNETIPMGSYVNEFDIVHIDCPINSTLIGQTSLFCQNGKWNSNFPSCESYCDGTLLHGLSVRSICNFGTFIVECPNRIRPGTGIQFRCNFGYTRNPNVSQFIKCLPDGTFDKSPLPCVHSCGRVASPLVALSKHGIPINSSSAPWHVSIHERNSINYNFICSGSIVSPRVIITAAHCFWNEHNLMLENYTEYLIIAGRSSSNYTTEQDDYSQLVQVEKVYIPLDYSGRSGHFRNDIAFLKLKTALRYTPTISAICMPKDIRNTASNYVLSNREGFITGFGRYNQLERLKMTTLGYHDCFEKIPLNSQIADDKFCIINKEGASVCRGDSGAGFFTKKRNSEYTLWGVLSNSPIILNDCAGDDDDTLIAITNINYMTTEFKLKLLNAIKEDETLF